MNYSAVAGLYLLAAGLAGCGGSSSVSSTAGQSTESPAALAGKALFFDTSLSASGKQSCGTCHVPSRAFTADPATDNGLPVPLGGPNMDQTGFRNAPSLMYASFTPPFTLTGGPVGGFFRDGRASSLAAQAQQPFVTAFEMANADAAAVVTKLQNSPTTLAAFVAAYGTAPLGDPDAALADMGAALAAYETEDPSFHPFSSKYDYWLGGRRRSRRRSRMVLHCSTIRARVTAPPAIPVRRRATASTRCSRISASTTSVCRAIGRFPRTT